MSPFDSALLAATVAIMAPLLLAAAGEVVSQRSGVLNIGLEGFMLTGAFFGMWAAAAAGGDAVLGLIAAIVAGIAVAAVMGIATIVFEADQVVTGVGINLLALGLTGFLAEASGADLSILQPQPVSFPLLSDIPLIGRALFDQQVSTYLAFLAVIGVWWLLFRTQLGIVIRACGEYPSAADTAGHAVNRIRFACVLLTGAAAGCAGALVSVIDVGTFQDNMMSGRGFLVLAAVVLARWHPLGLILAVALFAGTDALQLRLQAQGAAPVSIWILLTLVGGYWLHRNWKANARWGIAIAALVTLGGLILLTTRPEVVVPFQFWRALPYVVTMAVLATVRSMGSEPAYLTRPYRRGE